MRCVYINLDAATARRQALERNFRDHAADGWSLTRVPAVDAAQAQGIDGNLTDAEKACFLSHKQALAASLAHDEHVFILEDDAIFGRETCRRLTRLVDDGGREWDLLYTDIVVPRIAGMAELLLTRRRLMAEGETMLLDLKGFRFAGATAYVVNRNAKARLHAHLDSQRRLDLAYDLVLRDEVYASRFKACTAFPFLTSLSEAADQTSVPKGAEMQAARAWNTFRRMVWREGSWESQHAAIEAMRQNLGAEAQAFGTLWASVLDGVGKGD